MSLQSEWSPYKQYNAAFYAKSRDLWTVHNANDGAVPNRRAVSPNVGGKSRTGLIEMMFFK